MTLKVPIVGTGVVSEGAGVSPATNGGAAPPVQPTETPAQPQQRQSLHDVRMKPQRTPVEVRGEFDSFGRVKWVPVEQAQAQADAVADVDDSTVDAGGSALDGAVDVPPLTTQTHATAGESVQVNELQRQIADLTQTVNVLAQVQLRGALPQAPPKPAAPTPPDPTQFDFYDPASTAEFHRLNNAYIQATVRHEVNTALEPHNGALQDAELNKQYNAVYAQYGQEANFKDRMGAALQLMAKLPGISIPEAFDAVGGLPLTASPQQPAATTTQPVAKPAQRTMTREEAAQKAEQARKLPASQGVSGTPEPGLPASLRGKTDTLGRIMFHNQMSGRARPIGN